MKRYAWIAALVLAADQWTKHLARGMTGPVTLLPGLLGLRHCENTGMAFGLFSGMPWLLGIVSAAFITLGVWLLRGYRLGPCSRIAAMLVLGGAVGNMLDRFFRGAVTDMFEVLAFRFAVFNAADAALVLGCALMALSLVCCPADWEKINVHKKQE